MQILQNRWENKGKNMKRALIVAATGGFLKGFLISDMKLLQKMGYDNISDIFIAEYDKGKINVVTY